MAGSKPFRKGPFLLKQQTSQVPETSFYTSYALYKNSFSVNLRNRIFSGNFRSENVEELSKI